MRKNSLRILLDHSCPRQVAKLLPGHEVQISARLGWAELTNGELLSAAEMTGFSCMISADQNLGHQQNLRLRRLALVILSTNSWPVLRDDGTRIEQAVGRAGPGSYERVEFIRPALIRRRWTPPSR